MIPLLVMLDGINRHIVIFVSSLSDLRLQIEPCDDAGGNDASDVLNNISVVNTDSGMPAIKQVNNFISHGFVT